MMFPKHSLPCAGSNRGSVLAVASLVAAAALAVPGMTATAQLTPQQLVALSGGTYGPEYQQVADAIAAFRQGKIEAARQTLLAVKKQHPELAPADVMLAQLQLSVGRTGDAERSLDRATRTEAADPEPFVILAEIALREGRRAYAGLGYTRGEELLKTYKANARRLRQLTLRVHAGLAAVDEWREQYDSAATHLQAWMDLDPKAALPVGSLGRVKFLNKQYQEARAAFAKLAALDKEAPPVEIAMGRLFWDNGLREEAQQSMEAAVKADPEDIRVRLTVAEWALTAGLLALAQQNVDAALALDKESVGARVLSARMARQAGDLPKAEKILSAAVLAAPTSFAATNELARTLAAMDDAAKHKSGLDYARQNHKALQGSKSAAGVEAMVTFGWLLLRNGRGAEAEAVLNALPTGSTISPENAYYAAKIYLERGKRQLAANALKAALQGDVAFPGRRDAETLLQSLSTPVPGGP